MFFWGLLGRSPVPVGRGRNGRQLPFRALTWFLSLSFSFIFFHSLTFRIWQKGREQLFFVLLQRKMKHFSSFGSTWNFPLCFLFVCTCWNKRRKCRSKLDFIYNFFSRSIQLSQTPNSEISLQCPKFSYPIGFIYTNRPIYNVFALRSNITLEWGVRQ